MDDEKKTKGVCDEQRREFLKTSMYAAYATPVIMSMLVEKASAGSSGVYDKNKNCSDPAFACLNQQACVPPPGMCD